MAKSVLSDKLVRRQTNGHTGEQRTLATFIKHLWIMKLNPDVDGGDFLIADPKPTNVEERQRRSGSSMSVQGIIQCKYFEKGGVVYVDNEYLLEGNYPRLGFFLHIHTDDEEFNPKSYFLFPQDVFSLPQNAAGTKRRFSITKGEDQDRFLVRSNRLIIERIKNHLDSIEARATERQLFQRTLRGRFAFEDKIEYHLLILTATSVVSLSNKDEVRIILARTQNETRPIDPRGDLLLGGDTFSWGSLGGGPKMSAWSILAHHLEGVAPTHSQMHGFLMYLSTLKMEKQHVIQGNKVTQILQKYSPPLTE